MKANEEIIKKLEKILRLAGDKGASQGEAEAAMARAKELAMRYQIDIASIDPNKEQNSNHGGIEMDSSLKTKSKYEQPYHRWIYLVLRECFDVQLVRHGGTDFGGGFQLSFLSVIGDPVDVQIVKVLFPWLQKIFPRSLSKQVSSKVLTYSASHTNGWYRGFSAGIIESNKREVEKLSREDSEKWGLIVRNKKDAIEAFMEEKFKGCLLEQKSRKVSSDILASAMGYEEGRKIKFNQLEN